MKQTGPKTIKLLVAGENNEISVFDGAPFKFTKTLREHTGFINKIAFRQDGIFFASASADKSVVIYDTETLEVTKKIDKAHTKGIIDLVWVNDNTIATASSDNIVKHWNVDTGAEFKTLNPNFDGKEKIENQALGLISTPDATLSVSLNSNINVWNQTDIESGTSNPSYVIQGHSHHISSLTYAAGVLVSGD
jgi:WD repeat-containing protein 1 (actin-interacting protein 1)